MNHFDFFPHDLNLLVAFDALLAERSVSRAAERVGVTQSALSQSLARLRRVLGDELFLRGAAGMAPTAVATQLAPRVRAALEAAHAVLVRGAVWEPAQERRVFRIGMSDAQQAVLLPPLLARVQAAAPGVVLNVPGFERARVQAQLAAGELDLAVSRFDTVPAELLAEDLFEERHLCLYDPACVRVSRPMTLAQYLAHPHVLLSFAGDLQGVMDEQLAQQGQQRRVVAATPHAHLVALLVKGSGNIALLPGRIAQQAAQTLQLALAEPPLPLAAYRLRMVWHARSQGEPGHAWLLEQLRAVASRLQPALSLSARSPRRKGSTRASKASGASSAR